jgi:hypothetical protein
VARGAPKKPAPVAGPGKLARRTDGGPGSASQPLRVPSGGAYGDRKASEDQQQSAPLAVANGPSTGGGGAPIPPPSPEGVFGPTKRPGESPLAGAQVGVGGNPIAQDVDGFLRVLYSKFPHPGIHQLIRKDMRP